jgi:hypothetical protein
LIVVERVFDMMPFIVWMTGNAVAAFATLRLVFVDAVVGFLASLFDSFLEEVPAYDELVILLLEQGAD